MFYYIKESEKENLEIVTTTGLSGGEGRDNLARAGLSNPKLSTILYNISFRIFNKYYI